MKCHYEVLGVPKSVNDNDLKKAYKKLALKWHPDKNLDNLEEAKEQFQLVQQAWEVLSDPHERAWYDDHREAILKGGIGQDYTDNSLDLFQYFSTSCFKGYGDDEKGFYTVYRTVFEKLTAEDAEFADEDSDIEVPSFGDSQSSYEDVVHPFYTYWQSYNTKRTFTWLDVHDIRNAPNRKILRLIEKENKKIRSKAKKERNEEVQNLVAFVRKRDKRVQAYAALLAERAKENLKKTEEIKKLKLLERQKQLKEHTISEWSQFSNVEEELKVIEANLAAEFKEKFSSNEDTDNEDTINNSTLYCIACNKIFKTHKAFMNHENSKKHKDNVTTMKAAMIKDDEDMQESTEENDENSEPMSPVTTSNNVPKHEEKLATDSQLPDFFFQPQENNTANCGNEYISDNELISDTETESLTTLNAWAKNKNTEYIPLAVDPQINNEPIVINEIKENQSSTSEDELISDEDERRSAALKKSQKKKKRNKIKQKSQTEDVEDLNNANTRKPKTIKNLKCKTKINDEVKETFFSCNSCVAEFSSRNKLFEHLRETGHSTVKKPNKNPNQKKKSRKKE